MPVSGRNASDAPSFFQARRSCFEAMKAMPHLFNSYEQLALYNYVGLKNHVCRPLPRMLPAELG